MAVEYDLEDSLSLPDGLYDKVIDGYHVIVAPQNPNWIVLNEKEHKMF